jgi:hypothetical protein
LSKACLVQTPDLARPFLEFGWLLMSTDQNEKKSTVSDSQPMFLLDFLSKYNKMDFLKVSI